jgi:ABC-2 type transport system ATP-binding protein
MIAGILQPDSGEVRVGGTVVSARSLDGKRRIGFVPQELALYDDLSAEENLRFFGSLYAMHGAKLATAIDDGLAFVGLETRRRGPVRAFSGGMKRRLNLAAALLHDPDFLVLDEPTVGVDPQSRNQIFDALEQLLSRGKTILYTTHYMEEVERLCSRAAIMDEGLVIAEGDLAALYRIVPTKNLVRLTFRHKVHGVIENWEGVRLAKVEECAVVLEVDDMGEHLGPALSGLAGRFGGLDEVNTVRPSLEEVFLTLTGRTLRDD